MDQNKETSDADEIQEVLSTMKIPVLNKRIRKPSKRKYNIYPKENQKKILQSVKDELRRNKNIQSNIPKGNNFIWTEALSKVDYKEVNKIIKKVVPNYKRKLKLDSKTLTGTRKQLKNWLRSENEVEKKDEMPRFLTSLTQVIQSMKTRSFETLHREIIPVIRAIHMESERVIEGNIFSKHYWCDFRAKHQNINKLWKKLPISRNKQKANSSKLNNQATPPQSPSSLPQDASSSSNPDCFISYGDQNEGKPSREDMSELNQMEECDQLKHHDQNFSTFINFEKNDSIQTGTVDQEAWTLEDFASSNLHNRKDDEMTCTLKTFYE